MLMNTSNFLVLDRLVGGLFPESNYPSLGAALIQLNVETLEASEVHRHLRLTFTDTKNQYTVLANAYRTGGNLITFEMQCNNKVFIKHTDGFLARRSLDNTLAAFLQELAQGRQRECAA